MLSVTLRDLAYLKCALSVHTHLRHGHQHLLVDELRVSFGLNLLTLCYQLVQRKGKEKKGGEMDRRGLVLMANCGVSRKCKMSNV